LNLLFQFGVFDNPGGLRHLRYGAIAAVGRHHERFIIGLLSDCWRHHGKKQWVESPKRILFAYHHYSSIRAEKISPKMLCSELKKQPPAAFSLGAAAPLNQGGRHTEIE